MRIEMCREECYDLSNLQAAGEQLSPKNSIFLYLRNIFEKRFNNCSLHISRKLARQY